MRIEPWYKRTFSSIVAKSDLSSIPLDLADPFVAGKPANKLFLLWRMAMPVVTSATEAYAQCNIGQITPPRASPTDRSRMRKYAMYEMAPATGSHLSVTCSKCQCVSRLLVFEAYKLEFHVHVLGSVKGSHVAASIALYRLEKF